MNRSMIVYINIYTCSYTLPHALVPFEKELLVPAPLENLNPLVGHLSHGRQLNPFQQSLVVRDRHDGALIVGQESAQPRL